MRKNRVDQGSARDPRLGRHGLRRRAGCARTNVCPALEVFDAAKTPADYRESADLLESLLADGFRNGAVYYNLGNAYFRAGEYGRAIAAYRKAKPYRPRDPYLEANLRQALSVAPGRLARVAPAMVESRDVLERQAVVSGEGVRGVRGLHAGGPRRRHRSTHSAPGARTGSASCSSSSAPS